MHVLITIGIVLLAVSSWYYLPRILIRTKPSALPPQGLARSPEDFLWGTGEDAYQHEGGNFHADWHPWEQSEPRPFKDGSTSGPCVDFWYR